MTNIDVEREPIERDQPGIDRYSSDTHERRAEREASSRETLDRANANSNRPDYGDRSRDAGEGGERKSSLRQAIEKNFNEQKRKEARDEQRLNQHRTKVERVREREQQEAEEREAARPKTLRGAIEASVEQANQRQPEAAGKEKPDRTEPSSEGEANTTADAGDAEQYLRGLPADLAEVLKPHLATIKEAGVSPTVGIQRLLEWHENLRKDPANQIPKLMQAMGIDPAQFGGSEFNQVIAPYQEAFDQAKVPPPEGVRRLLMWHDMLRRDPKLGLSQLAHAFGLDPRQPLFDADVAHRWQQHTQNMEVQAQQEEARTTGAVHAWGQSKPHFETVRQLMSQILVDAAKRGQLQPLLDSKGNADLDKIYQIAVAHHPQTKGEVEAQTRTQAETSKAVDKFGRSKNHWVAARPIMAQILVGAANTGTAAQYLDAKGRVDLDKLYDAACYADPTIRSKMSGAGKQRQQRPAQRQGKPVRSSILDAIDEVRARESA